MFGKAPVDFSGCGLCFRYSLKSTAGLCADLMGLGGVMKGT